MQAQKRFREKHGTKKERITIGAMAHKNTENYQMRKGKIQLRTEVSLTAA